MADPRYSLFAARAVFDPRLTATDVRVLAALGTYTNKQGWCNPKQATIAIRVGVSRTTVTASMKRLVKSGYLESKAQVIAGRGQTASNYRVILDLDPMSAWTTPEADVSHDDTPMSATTTGGVVPVGHPPSNWDDTQKEHSQENIPKSVVAEAPAREAPVVSKAMIEEAQARAGKAINLTSGHVHHGNVFRSLLTGGCDWQDILDAIDGLSASMSARGRLFHSWEIIRESAVQNRDRRLAGVPLPEQSNVRTGPSRAFDTGARPGMRSQPRSAATIIMERAREDEMDERLRQPVPKLIGN